MKPILVLLLTSLLVSTDGCWYQSKKPTMRKIEQYMHKIGKDVNEGVSRAELESIAEDAPSAVGWLIKKVHGVEGVLKDCDTDGDGVIHLEEAKRAKHCADSCWKQIGIQMFLN